MFTPASSHIPDQAGPTAGRPPVRQTGPATWAALVILVIIGEVGLWMWLPEKWQRTQGFAWGFLTMIPLAAIPPLRRRVALLIEWLRHPSPQLSWFIALALGVIAAGTAYWRITEARQPLFPMLHDEHSYLIQAQHLAQLRLWMPAHPLADFFESFHILVEPVYASIYWPGTGLMNVWGVWLNLPHYAVPLALYALTVALAYRIAAAAMDGLAGILAALIVAAQPHLAAFSTIAMSQVPAALLGAAMLWAWWRWRAGERRLPWTAVIGALAGWLAITRPADALAFALPIGLAMLLVLVKESRAWKAVPVDDPAAPAPRLGPRVLATFGVLVLAALPFLCLQLILNYGTTGSLLEPPYVRYLNLYQPGTEFGEGELTAASRPTGEWLRQKRDLYELWVIPRLEELSRQSHWTLFWRERVPMTVRSILPSLWLLPPLLIGMLATTGLRRRRRRPDDGEAASLAVARMALAVIVLFVLLYLSNPFYLSHYPLPLVVPAALLVVLGLRTLVSLARGEVRSFLVVLVVGGILLGTGLQMWQYKYNRPFDWFIAQPDMVRKYREIPRNSPGPALVLVRYEGPGDGQPFHWEPVYNPDVAWPDDAAIVWANDLDGRRHEILAYYAEHQPERQVIIWNRAQNTFYTFGSVTRALADQESGRIDQVMRENAGAQRFVK